MLTCFGKLSRNRTCGFRLAKGEKLEDIIEDIGTVEGIPTLKVLNQKILEWEDKDNFPIIQAIHNVVFENISLKMALKLLMKVGSQEEFSKLPYLSELELEANKD